MNKRNSKDIHKVATRAGLMLALATALPLAGTAQAANPNYKLCFSSSATATVDGNVVDDPAWGAGAWQFGSWKYEFGSGGAIPDGVVQGTRDTDRLYFAFSVNHDKTWDDNDVIVLTIDPGAGNPRRRFHVFPVCGGVGACLDNPATPAVNEAGKAREVKTWTYNAATSSWTNQIVNPTWVQTGVTSQDAGTSKSWSVEVSIPISTAADPTNYVPIPASGLFGLYFNMIRIDGTDGSARQMDWPVEATDIGSPVPLLLEAGTPAEAQWGNGTRGGVTCNGVSIGWSDIKTNQTPTSYISLNQANYFTATVHNSSVDSTGAAVAANGVRATFKIANWGIPGSSAWSEVPAASNKPTGNIPANGSADLTTGAWLLDPTTERPKYSPPNDHQCIRVDLDSVNTTGNVSFLNHIAYRNMDFAETMSPVRREARISAAGFKLPRGKTQHEMVLKEYAYNTPKGQKWVSEISGLTKAGDGRYTLKLAPNAAARIQSAVTPPSVDIPISVLKVAPGTGGVNQVLTKSSGSRPLTVAVQPGNVVTLIASGQIEKSGVAREPVRLGPLGGDERMLRRAIEPRAARVAEPKRLVKQAPVGMLVGSFDQFKTSFVVGDATTLQVPKGATTLYLAVNDVDGEFATQKGEGYSVQVTQTAALPQYAAVGRLVPSRADELGVRLPLGANLPTWMMCGELKNGKKLIINGKTYDAVDNAGCFGYVIKKIKKEPRRWWPWGG